MVRSAAKGRKKVRPGALRRRLTGPSAPAEEPSGRAEQPCGRAAKFTKFTMSRQIRRGRFSPAVQSVQQRRLRLSKSRFDHSTTGAEMEQKRNVYSAASASGRLSSLVRARGLVSIIGSGSISLAPPETSSVSKRLAWVMTWLSRLPTKLL